MFNTIRLNKIRNKYFRNDFYFFFFCLFYLISNYSYLINQPISLHFIRQTDSISFILYYLAKSSFNFFDLGNLNLSFVDGKTSCEFPIIYYLVFIVFKIFGIHFVIIRWFSLLFSIVSIHYLLKLSFFILKNKFLSMVSVLLVISSTVYRYYSINFVPDSFAISSSFIALYYFFEFTESSKKSLMIFSLFFFTLSALIKIYFGVYLVAACVYLLITNKEYVKMILLSSLLCFGIIVFWYAYSIYYNKIYHSNYYLTKSLPIWQMNKKEIEEISYYITDYWYTKYYLPTIFHVFLGFGIVIIIPLLNKFIRKYNLFLFLCFIGSIFYFLLFFKQFKDHDYYFLPFIPFLFLLTIFSIFKVLNFNKNKYVVISISLLLFVTAVLGFNYSTLNMNRRFNNSIDQFSIVGYQLADIDLFTKQNSVSSDSKFIIVGDKTKNASLIFLNRFGWIYPSFNNSLDNLQYNLPKADYLLILKPSENKIPASIKEQLANCERITFNSNHIYSLRKHAR